MVMTFAVRALSVFLTVWLTAAAAFPLCCWSMSSAHAHQPVPDSAPSDAASVEHHHDHHGSADSEAVGGAAPALSSIAAYDCDAELADAAAAMAVVKRAALRPMAESAADFVVPTVSAHAVAGSNTSPPGFTFTSAFLSPLRI